MSALPVIAIFDIGKTNKKFFLFDENYKIVFEKSVYLTDTIDEDGDACENLDDLRLFILDSLREIFQRKDFEIKTINFSSYGASFVYLDKSGKTIAPLYSYLKTYSEILRKQFYNTYGGEDEFSLLTASPVLGDLNSGMQLYRIKYEKPELFQEIKYALHLPQYLSFLITGKAYSDITSIGCHTNLWNFKKNEYHDWVKQEGVLEKLAPIFPCSKTIQSFFEGNNFCVGIGLHDSSAALIPYLMNFNEPFVLISTGTWCISLNPFNKLPLTKEGLKNDCLYYMSYEGSPVKASRLFAGYEHEEQLKRLNNHFHKDSVYYKSIEYNPGIILNIRAKNQSLKQEFNKAKLLTPAFSEKNLDNFLNYEEAYHCLVLDIVMQQYQSTQLIMDTKVKRIFVDGGFSKNIIYMNLLAAVFNNVKIYAATIAQATATGTALSVHTSWNKKATPGNMIELKCFSHSHQIKI
jgi:sugar (pentulose or hexulose) kinase